MKWKQVWSQLGIDPDANAKSATLDLPVNLTLDGTRYAVAETVAYSGTAGKSGKFKKQQRR